MNRSLLITALAVACGGKVEETRRTGSGVGVGQESEIGERPGYTTVDSFKDMPDCADRLNANLVVEVRSERKKYRCDPATGTWIELGKE